MGERMKIVGLRDVSFEDKKRPGQMVEGTSFYFTREDDNVDGLMAGKLFIGSNRLTQLSYCPDVGDDVIIYYDRYGKPADVQRAS